MGDRLAAQICLRDAWPAPQVAECDGWLLRAGQGGYNRINSVWTGRFHGDRALAIERAEAFYRSRGLKPRFQMLDLAEPAGLDAELDRRGYRRELACSDMAKVVAGGALPAGISLAEDVTTDWLGLYAAEQPPEKAAELPLILAGLPARRAFIICRRGAAPAGVALVTRVGADAAVDCVLTGSVFRRSGVAHSVLQAAEAWAASEGVRRLVLSVVDDNTGAVALYARLGYRKLAHYHYRVAAG